MVYCRFLTLGVVLSLLQTSLVSCNVELPRKLLRSEQQQEEEPQRDLEGRNKFVSFFSVVYDIYDDVDIHEYDLKDALEAVAHALVPAYNDLIQDFNDPFERRMTDVRILHAQVDGRRRLDAHGRRLTSTTALLESAGDCTGCASNSKYSNQVTPGKKMRNRALYQFNDPRAVPRQKLMEPYYSTSVDSKPDPESPDGESPDGPDGLPSEQDILDAYSEVIMAMNDPIVKDVIFLDEVEIDDVPIVGSKKSGKKKSKKSSKKDSKKSSKKGEKGNGGSGDGKKKKSAGDSKSSVKSGKKSGKGKGGKGKRS
jgi:hypothetical protein